MALISRWITYKQLKNIHLGYGIQCPLDHGPNENKYLSDPATYYSFLIQNVKPRFTSGSAPRGRSGWTCPLRGSEECGKCSDHGPGRSPGAAIDTAPSGRRTTGARSRSSWCAGVTTSRRSSGSDSRGAWAGRRPRDPLGAVHDRLDHAVQTTLPGQPPHAALGRPRGSRVDARTLPRPRDAQGDFRSTPQIPPVRDDALLARQFDGSPAPPRATRTRRPPTPRRRARRLSTARGHSRPRPPGPPRPATRPSSRRPGSTSPRRSVRTAGSPARPAATRPGGAGARSPTSPTTPRRSRAHGPRDDTGSRARSDPVPPVDQLVAPDHDQLAQAVDAHVLDQLLELAAGHDREYRRRRMDPEVLERPGTTRPRGVGSAARVGRPSISGDPGRGRASPDGPACRVETTTTRVELRRTTRSAGSGVPRASRTTPRCLAGSERLPVAGDPSTTVWVELRPDDLACRVDDPAIALLVAACGHKGEGGVEWSFQCVKPPNRGSS